MTCNCCSGATAPTGRVDFQYAAKIVCGVIKPSPSGNPLPPGEYFTKINIHNPSRCDCITFRWKVALGLPLKVGPISDFADATLCPDEALEIDGDAIFKSLGISPPDPIEGWLVIESPAELDVVAVYGTAQSSGGHVNTFHTERVQPRCLSACEDLDFDISTGVAAWEVKGPGSAAIFQPATLSLPVGPWAPPPTGSRWIIPGALEDEGDYTFRLTFKLCTGFTSPSLNLSLLADYYAHVFLNGNQVPLSPGTQPMFSTLNSAATTSYFKAGANELTIVVHNNEQATPVGLALHGAIEVQNGQCAGDAPPSLVCPQICYEAFTRGDTGPLSLFGNWSGPACNGAETNWTAGRYVYAFRAHLTGTIVPGTAIEYRAYQVGWTSWTPEGQTCGWANAPGPAYISAVEFRFVLAPVCCSIGYQIRRGIPLNWAYDGQIAGNTTGVNEFIDTLRVQISCV